MPATTEILDNVVTIEEMISSRSAAAPDVPYLELAKCIRVTRPERWGGRALGNHSSEAFVASDAGSVMGRLEAEG
jgi:hypothetical protein